MSTLLIACQTLENELNYALKKSPHKFDIVWFESGLHNFPKKMNKALQELIDDASGKYDTALMVMGFCGNSVAGLNSRGMTLVIPKVDDCISMLLGSCKNRMTIPDAGHTYFMTDGWLKGERNIWVEYQYTMEKYGEEQGEVIFDMMLGSYKALALIDSGAYDTAPTEAEMLNIAKHLKLKYRKLEGTVEYIDKLLTAPYDEERFLIVPPNTEIQLLDLIELY